MIRREKNGIHWLEFSILQDHPIRHAVYLRRGGASSQPFDSLNFGLYIGDPESTVQANKQRVLDLLQCNQLHISKQIHGTHAIRVTNRSEPYVGEGDILHTSEKERALLIKHADCQAAILYDPEHHALLTAHVGWRGNVANGYGKAVQVMRKWYGTNPAKLLVGISPSLGPKHAEFVHYKEEFPEELWRFRCAPHHFDLWAMSQAQLVEAGLHPNHIEIAESCTYENSDDFFSYRREKETGRNGTIALLI